MIFRVLFLILIVVFSCCALTAHCAVAKRLLAKLRPVSTPQLPVNFSDAPEQKASSSIYYFKTETGIRLVHKAPRGEMSELNVSCNSITKSINIKYSPPKKLSNLHDNTQDLGDDRVKAVLGLFQAGSIHYLGLVTKSSSCEDIPYQYAQRVEEVKFVPITDVTSNINPQKSTKDMPLSAYDQSELDLLYASFYRHTFFYSSQPLSHDITRTIQGNSNLKSFYKKKNADADISFFPSTFRDCDSRFFWNKNTLQPLIKAVEQQDFTKKIKEELLNTWITPVMNAALTSMSFDLGDRNSHYKLSLVSRRSCGRQGPRLRMRGIDSTGEVANFVETEQILANKDAGVIASFVQVRGSIPLFWQQPDRFAPKPPILVAADTLESDHAAALSTHLQDLQQNYVVQYAPSLRECTVNTTCSCGVNGGDSCEDDLVPSIILLNLIDKLNSQGVLGGYMMRVLASLNITGNAICNKRDDQFLPLDRNVITVSNYLLDLTKNHTLTRANQEYTYQLTPFRQALRQAINRRGSVSSTTLRHVWYDFHYHHQGPAVASSSPTRNILLHLHDVLNSNSSFFLSSYLFNSYHNGKKWKERADIPPQLLCEHIQTNIIRTNCVDSLDRTNVAQSEIARFVLLRQLKLLDPSLSLELTAKFARATVCVNHTVEKEVLSSTSVLPPKIEKQFRKLWSTNGDKISMLYAGTRALRQDYVRKGRRTLKGVFKDAINSAKRYYLNIFEDTSRQHGVNLVIGSATHSPFIAMVSLNNNNSDILRRLYKTGGVTSARDNDNDLELGNTKAATATNVNFTSASDVLNTTISEFKTLLTSRTSKVMAALDQTVQDSKPILAALALPVRLRLRSRAVKQRKKQQLRWSPSHATLITPRHRRRYHGGGESISISLAPFSLTQVNNMNNEQNDLSSSSRLPVMVDLHGAKMLKKEKQHPSNAALSFFSYKKERLLLIFFCCLGALARTLAATHEENTI